MTCLTPKGEPPKGKHWADCVVGPEHIMLQRAPDRHTEHSPHTDHTQIRPKYQNHCFFGSSDELFPAALAEASPGLVSTLDSSEGGTSLLWPGCVMVTCTCPPPADADRFFLRRTRRTKATTRMRSAAAPPAPVEHTRHSAGSAGEGLCSSAGKARFGLTGADDYVTAIAVGALDRGLVHFEQFPCCCVRRGRGWAREGLWRPGHWWWRCRGRRRGARW